MVVVRLMGGMGNQLFQYSFGRALATKLKSDLVLDLTTLLDRTPRENFVFREFDLDLFELNTYYIFDEKLKKKYKQKSLFRRLNLEIKEVGFQYSDIYKKVKKQNVYLDGYWQSYKYFEDISTELREELKFKMPLSHEQNILADKIRNSKSVCVNFRRADFVSIPSAIETHGIASLEYYYEAIKILKEKIGSDITVFVFSDDVEWCESNFIIDLPVIYVQHSLYKGERFSSYLQLMTCCKYFIIPNSTFGWWAAWLSSSNDKIVISPKQWFADAKLQSQTQDLRPKTWITI
jgi:hypothetical protein